MRRGKLLTDEGRKEIERTIKMLSEWYREAKARGDRIEIWEGEINALFRLLQLDKMEIIPENLGG